MYYLHRRYTTQPQNKILQTKKFSLKKCSYLDPIKTSRKQCNCLYELYCNQRTDAYSRFLTDKDDVFQTDFFDILLAHVASFRSYHRWLAITLYSASAILLICAGYFNVP